MLFSLDNNVKQPNSRIKCGFRYSTTIASKPLILVKDRFTAPIKVTLRSFTTK